MSSSLDNLKRETFENRVWGRLMSFALAELGDLRGQRVVESACGMGRISVLFALMGADVVGIDLREQSLEAAKEFSSQMGVADRCEFVHGSSSAMPIDDRSVDVVFSRSAMQYMNKGEVFAEFGRILKPMASLVLVENLPCNPFAKLQRIRRKLKAKTPDEIAYVNSVKEYLSFADIRRLERCFESVVCRESNVFRTLTAQKAATNTKFKFLDNIAGGVDQFVLKFIPFACYLAWGCAVVCRGKLNDTLGVDERVCQK